MVKRKMIFKNPEKSRLGERTRLGEQKVMGTLFHQARAKRASSEYVVESKNRQKLKYQRKADFSF